MPIRPLTNQVLVRKLPVDAVSTGGIAFPDIAADSPRGEKARPFKAVVLAIGPWRKTNNGFAVLPDFGIGATVLCTPYAGTTLGRFVDERMQLVSVDDVLALVET